MKLQKIILAASAAAVLALSASCRATGEDGGGGGDGGPVALNIVFDPNGGYWFNSDDQDDKSDTEAKSTTQIVGRLITPPALSETDDETPLPLYLDWDGQQQRRSNLYQFVGWYQLPEGETTPPARIQLGEEVPQDLIARVVSTDTIVDVDALLPGYNTVTGELSEVTLYALWLEPPECYRVSFYKFFNGTDPQELIGTPVELQEGNSGVSQSQIPSSVSRTHYNKNSDNWYKVLDDGTVSDTAFDFSAEVTDSHKLVMKWTGITYQISFKPEGGTPAPSVVQIQYPTPVAASNIPTVTRNYYTLGGWYKTGAQITDANKLTVGSLITANTEYTANWNPTDNYYLDSLSVTVSGSNKITGFASNTFDYQAFIQTGATFSVTAKAINPNAKITITYNGAATSVTNAPSTTTGVTVSSLSPPGLDEAQKVINVIVKTTTNVTQTYQITVDLDGNDLDTWTGTAYNKLNGGTASDGKTITQLIAWNADRSIKGVATLGTPNANDQSRTWQMRMPQSPQFRPVFFIVSFYDGTNNFISDEVTPAGAPLAPAAGIVINATKTGIRLSDANEFFQLGDPANRDKDFALGGDIDLTNTGTAWTGPDGYIGHFYGNGYTIKGLELTKTAGETGLFNSLGNGAVIENFTLEVSTPGSLTMTGASVFGGIVGSMANTTATMQDITVKGNLAYDGVGNYMLMAGGFVGQVSGTSGNLTITRCVSQLNMTLGNVSGSGQGIACGTMTGRVFGGGAVTITKSYSTGNVSMVLTDSVARSLYAGMVPHSYGGNVNIEECYNSGNVFVKGENVLGFAGSILGNTHGNGGLASVSRSAALSESVIVEAPNSYSGRIFGGRSNGGVTPTFSNNFARKNMLTGNDSTAQAQDVAGDAATAAGLGKSITELKTQTTWTNPVASGGLGWSAADWDFDGLSKSGAAFYWPRLK
ncbi:MAG: hypothetical protein Pg6A_09910 [Termitinemataceae bacterium]|nr:MAG: hypothetical protein Pg6A_09910 [Termitinemataceae bacterium]